MKPILVVGDFIVDAYHYGKLGGTAPDFPTILAHQDTTKLSYGGAGLVVSNLLALEKKVIFLTLVGTGEYTDYAQSYTHKNLKTIFIKDPKRATTVKERFWVDGHKLLEWHHFDTDHLGAADERRFISEIKKQLPQVGVVLLADYRHGLLSQKAAATIVQLCRTAKIPLFVDSQIVHAQGNHHWYKGATLFLLNQKEALHVDPLFNKKTIRASLERFQKILGTKNIVVKLGAEGSAALVGTKLIRTSQHSVHALDPVGAGDAFAAALATGSIPPTPDDLRRANTWAALATTTIGTEPPKLSDLLAILPHSV